MLSGQSAEMYQILQTTGAEYGPFSQSIDDLSFNSDGKAVWNVKMQQWAAINGRGFAQPHTVHETTLDGIVQIAYPAPNKGGRKILPTMVLIRIRKLWVSSVGLSDPALCVARIPDTMSFIEAASIPTSVLIFYFALVAKTYVTTSSKYRGNVLKNAYGLPEDYIFSGEGVDVVLDSYSEEGLLPWKYVACFGPLLVIGSKTDLLDADFLATEMLKNVLLAVIDPADIIRERPTLLTQLLNEVLGTVKEGNL